MFRIWLNIGGIFSIFLLPSFFSIASGQQPKVITNSIGMKLVLIPKGTFTMGSPPSEEGSSDDERQRSVTISDDYYISAHEVTQSQFQKIFKNTPTWIAKVNEKAGFFEEYLALLGKNPSYFQGDQVADRHPKTKRVVRDIDSSDFPVENVHWEDAEMFCKLLSSIPAEKAAGRGYRLPKEAEWEYACRAGSKTAYYFGDSPKSLGDYAWFDKNSNDKTHAVGTKKPNAWGLYDMHGNVGEWCRRDYRKSADSRRVHRGGSFDKKDINCRSASRQDGLTPSSNIGFRVVLFLR
jgi:formylglycine-generating enzyme required for sulfatase activity